MSTFRSTLEKQENFLKPKFNEKNKTSFKSNSKNNRRSLFLFYFYCT